MYTCQITPQTYLSASCCPSPFQDLLYTTAISSGIWSLHLMEWTALWPLLTEVRNWGRENNHVQTQQGNISLSFQIEIEDLLLRLWTFHQKYGSKKATLLSCLRFLNEWWETFRVRTQKGLHLWFSLSWHNIKWYISKRNECLVTHQVGDVTKWKNNELLNRVSHMLLLELNWGQQQQDGGEEKQKIRMIQPQPPAAW